MKRLLSIVIYLVGVSSCVMGHQTGLSYLKITASDTEDLLLVYKKPLEDSQAKKIQIHFPAYCTRVTFGNKTVTNGFIIDTYHLNCGEKGLLGQRIWVEGLIRRDKGILIEYQDKDKKEKQQNLLRASTPFMFIAVTHSSWNIFKEYVELGFFHILTGYDHLLFLLALIFLASSLKELFYSITAFTLSHSISLGLSVLGFLSVPIPYVEAMIALSIVILFREVIFDKKKIRSKFYLPLMVLLFGLLHGLGFASVLNSIGLPANDIFLALIAFNIGVELGQLLFVSFFSIVMFGIGYFSMAYHKKIEFLIAYCMGIVSSFWLIERMLAF